MVQFFESEVAGSIPDTVTGYLISLDLILPAKNGPGIDSTSNRNEYQEYILGG